MKIRKPLLKLRYPKKQSENNFTHIFNSKSIYLNIQANNIQFILPIIN